MKIFVRPFNYWKRNSFEEVTSSAAVEQQAPVTIFFKVLSQIDQSNAPLVRNYLKPDTSNTSVLARDGIIFNEVKAEMDKQYLIVVSSEEKELKWVFRIKEELYLKEAKFTNKY